MGGIILSQLDKSLKSLVLGLMLGDIFFVNGDTGDDNATGNEFQYALKTLAAAVLKGVTGHHDYILCCGAETGAGAISIAQADLHIIGVGNGGIENIYQRGFQYTCPATVDTLQPTAAADGLEIAGIQFVCSATDHILIDDAGADGIFFHHNTVKGSTTASDAIRLDLEGAQPVISDNNFYLCKLPIDVIGAYSVIARNYMQDVDQAAIGVNVNTGDYGIIDHNIFNFSGTTGDTGVKIAAGANYWTVSFNFFHTGLNANISDAGTGTFLVGNQEGAITGTSGASLGLAVEA